MMAYASLCKGAYSPHTRELRLDLRIEHIELCPTSAPPVTLFFLEGELHTRDTCAPQQQFGRRLHSKASVVQAVQADWMQWCGLNLAPLLILSDADDGAAAPSRAQRSTEPRLRHQRTIRTRLVLWSGPRGTHARTAPAPGGTSARLERRTSV